MTQNAHPSPHDASETLSQQQLALARSHVAAHREEERLKLAQRVGQVGTFEWDIPNNRILWTPELEVLYGLPPGGFEGKYENWAQRVHADDLQAAENNLQAAITEGSAYNVEFRVIHPDGTTHWLLGKGEVITYSEQGQAEIMIGVNIDITDLKKIRSELADSNQRLQDLNEHLEGLVIQRTEALEQSTNVLRQLNTELQRSNQELQDFAYVASHDLQEPLRKIQAFGNLLEEEYGEVIGSGKAYLDRMRNAAGRMRILIDDLLAFSRVTTKGLPFSSVDLNEIAQAVIDDLESHIQVTHGTIEIADLPTIDADPLQMRQMLQNLIGNALKFHQRDSAPIVKISAEMFTGSEIVTTSTEPALVPLCRLVIEDNGIGFDEKYLDRIFTVFQRLHGRSEYEGTGIGLAVVRKIVERHHGIITATSTPGQGSTFLITLPVQSTLREENTHGEER